ncbi:MAG TPA: sensor histidine kinase [Catenuloplanes sp.]
MTITSVAGERALRAGRGLAFTVIAALLALFAAGLVQWARHWARMPGGWTGPESRSAAEVRAALAEWGLPAGWWVALFLVLEVFLVAVSAVAAYVVLRSAVSGFRLYLAVALVLFATAGGGVPPAVADLYPALAGAAETLQGLAWFALFPLAYVFPDGRFVPGWTRWLPIAWLLAFVGTAVVADLWPLLLALFGSAAFAAVYRYVKVSGTVERQQTKWVALALAARFAFTALMIVTPLGALQDRPGPGGLAAYAFVMVLSYVLAALLPAAVAIAVVRHRLFDVDVVLSRTLLFVVLTGLVVSLYAGVVAGVGAVWPGETVVGPLVAAGIVAVGFNPVRAHVQRRVDRLVFGDRADPYGVLARLGQTLAAVVEPERVAPTIAETVRSALRTPYAAVALGDPPAVVAEAGRRPDRAVEEFPVVYQGRELGRLLVSGTDAADRRLLADLAGQCGAALSASAEAARTRALATDLQHARQQLVTAREEERRQIRRDLHDSLGPAIGGQALTIDAARALMSTDPDRADALLLDLNAHSRQLLSEVRRLARDLRPPALDELGLSGALHRMAEENAASADGVGPLPALPAAVEVAAYRIAHEALTNAVRHAGTCSRSVSTAVDGDRLVLVVADDGRGVPAGARSGVGFASMRERAEELGGTLTVSSGDGTRVEARLPLGVPA